MYDYNPDDIDLPVGNVIHGELVVGGGDELEVRRPSDLHIAAVMRSASPDQAAEAVASARRAFESGAWSRASPRSRARIMRRWADLIDENRRHLAILESVVSTRPFIEAFERDVPYCAEILRFYAELIDKSEGRVLASESHALNLSVHEPYGVVAAITPWNMPLILSMAKIAPALAAGNALILKPSELTPLSVSFVALLGAQAGLPPSQFSVVQGSGPAIGAPLVAEAAISAVSFTGSIAAGRAVMARAAESGPKPVSLELGGKSPVVVFEDAGLDNVAQLVSDSICRNGGQVCHAGTRLLMERSIADDLLSRVAARMRQRRLAGPTWDRAANMAPIVSEAQFLRIESIVAAAVDDGSEILLGGRRLEAPTAGCFFEPTIMTSSGPNSAIARTEVFGPVLCVEQFTDADEALELAKHPEFGLAASVHTRDLDRALRMSARLDAGTIWVNHHGPADLTSPFGGFGGSGFGKDFGADALAKFSRCKTVWINGRWTA